MKEQVPQVLQVRHLLVDQILLSLLKGERVSNVGSLGTSLKTAQTRPNQILLKEHHLKRFTHNVAPFHQNMIKELLRNKKRNDDVKTSKLLKRL
ncbi:hypothetical protein HanPI659440_Chr10g0396451 [Helianthus annuus]|nr:hypothetical protein HanPI659440_Chr10g0396451 [Helianthus annuus]